MLTEADTIEIAGRQVGGGAAPYVIAELGINHGGDLEVALRLLEAAAAAGADAVKLQLFDTDRFLSRSSAFFEVLRACELRPDDVGALWRRAQELGVTLFAACFDEGSADVMAAHGAPAFKIASGDITHTPLLRHVAQFRRPMIVSTGGATVAEIDAAVAAIKEAGPATPIALLHCVSNYPTQPGDANLACLATMRARYRAPIGFSDHTLGNEVAIAAVALGAELIEKHLTLDRGLPGPDHALSADPAGLASLISAVRAAHAAIGRAEKTPVEPADFIPQMRRSVAAARDIAAGAVIGRNSLNVKRPGTGIPPARIDQVVGRRAARDLRADQVLSWDDLE